jgi:hypothetical protein
MIARFSLAILFAALVATSRPSTSGGANDLLAVGVRLADGRLVLATPEGEAREAYELLLRSSAKDALLQGTTVYAPAPAAEPAELPGIVELVYYGHRSRVGRAPVVFTARDGRSLPGGAEAYAAARDLSRLPSAVTASAARVLLSTDDDAAYRDALEALAAVQSDAAASEARSTALDASAPVNRRIVAIRALKKAGGANAFPDVFAKLDADPLDFVRDAAR